ncbi:acetolactate decarboxylase [Asaia bogorensis]|uniref:acetolactate decarboxylase n=1 Tax=Asaia bogorensis TaxID=91915 RepID=UPI00285BC71E|nr:acetolactate decarboxylase [Asaia bogorensis]MDR6182896.1 acetolactate decarboxylase [Asaia bogorensis NBRC 16594]
MSRITQFSTIGALMAGHLQAEQKIASLCACHETGFGLGCSAGLNGELTICDGRVYEATAGEPLHVLPQHDAVPFVQITAFKSQFQVEVENITHETAYDRLCTLIAPDNIFMAVSVTGLFDHLVLRRPHRAVGESDQHRDVEAVAASQKIDRFEGIRGRLIGFWTPALFGRISVPGFHFHFLDDERRISGHVLEFAASHATLSAEEKPTIEITNPQSDSFRNRTIETDKLDDMIHRIEK